MQYLKYSETSIKIILSAIPARQLDQGTLEERRNFDSYFLYKMAPV